jgi:hypothetical protein
VIFIHFIFVLLVVLLSVQLLLLLPRLLIIRVKSIVLIGVMKITIVEIGIHLLLLPLPIALFCTYWLRSIFVTLIAAWLNLRLFLVGH